MRYTRTANTAYGGVRPDARSLGLGRLNALVVGLSPHRRATQDIPHRLASGDNHDHDYA